MPFVTELPRSAVAVVIDSFKTTPLDVPRLTLSLYDLTGYGLFLAFGDEKYLMNLDPATLAIIQNLLALLAGPNTPSVADLLAYIATLKAKGLGPVRIVLNVAMKYGPAVAALILKLSLLIKGE